MEATGLDHVVVVVVDIDEARTRYVGIFGKHAVGPVMEAQGYRRCIVSLGTQRLELCQPVEVEDPAQTQASRAFSATLASRGEGLHSIAVLVPDVAAAADEFRRAGISVVESSFSASFFVHPRALNGLIVQFLEPNDESAQLQTES